MGKPLRVPLQLHRIFSGEKNFGVRLLQEGSGKTIVIHMAMGNEDVLQPGEIYLLPEAGKGIRGGGAGIEQHNTPFYLCRVKVNLTDHVRGLYGVLSHGSPKGGGRYGRPC